MAKILSQLGVETSNIVEAWHVTQSIDAFTGTEAYDITLSGSLTLQNGTQGANKIATSDANGVISFTNSITASLQGTASYAITASYALNGGGGNATGSNYEIQFNKNGDFGATSSFKYNYDLQSLEHGFASTASGDYSLARGYYTQAEGDYSHAEGYINFAYGLGSHAEGSITYASGSHSHTEGYRTRTSGSFSHAEGYETISSGSYSHTEGEFTVAIGDSSHAEGSNTVAYGYGSHAEGKSSISSGSYSHAEGRYTIAEGELSHSEGSASLASGIASHAEGVATTSSGNFSHAEGVSSVASGIASHAEGFSTIASGFGSHAQGWLSEASSSYSSVQGTFLTSYYQAQTVVGSRNIIGSNPDLFVVGDGSLLGSPSNAFRVQFGGNCYSGATFINSGADYAKYFESYDGTAIPKGTVVELTGSFIKPCEIADNAIGVISTTPTVVGNSDSGTSDEWVGKYEKDKWGIPIILDAEYESPFGEKIPQPYKALSPDFDPSIPYTPRSERPEWNIVGIMGQIRVLKNQPIPSRWIKMKDIDDEIALYFVR